MAILAILEDLVFQSKLKEAAAPLGPCLEIVRDADSAVRQLALTPYSLIVVDLNVSMENPVALVRRLRQAAVSALIIGYCAHLQTDLQSQALAAGCSIVLPRSAFVQRLPGLFRDAVQNA